MHASQRAHGMQLHPQVDMRCAAAGLSSTPEPDSASYILLNMASKLLQNALEKGLLPDDATLQQLVEDRNSAVYRLPLNSLPWPDEPLRAVLIRASRPCHSGMRIAAEVQGYLHTCVSMARAAGLVWRTVLSPQRHEHC